MNIKDKLLALNCIENDYLQNYIELINANINTKAEKYKTNRHHIIPRCVFKLKGEPVDNSKDNIVNLSHSDHFLAHYYLSNCFTGTLKFYNSLACRYVETKYNLPIEAIVDNLEVYQQLCENAIKISAQQKLGTKNPHTPEWNKKISEANKGRVCSEEMKQYLSKLNKGKKLTGAALYNVQHEDKTNQLKAMKTPEHREKCRVNALGNKHKLGWKAPQSTKRLQSVNNGCNVPVKCVETGEVFYNLTECARKTNINRQYLMTIINNGQKCNARLLKKYSKETKERLKFYNGKHFIKDERSD